MLRTNASPHFDSEESVTNYMKSTFLDADYKIEHNWKMCFMHPYQYLEHPAYQEKRMELQQNNKSTEEHLGFLLFPPLYGGNNYVPVLNQEFMEVLATHKQCPPQTLGNSCDGVSLFKSVDVLLKFANFRNYKSPKIAVYKFLEGNPYYHFCDIYEEYEMGSPDPSYDSFSLRSLNGELDETDLNVQLRFSEIFLYDTKSRGSHSVPRSCPRQTTPVTLISFLQLRPFVVPRPISQRIKKKKKVSKKQKSDATIDKDWDASSQSCANGDQHKTSGNVDGRVSPKECEDAGQVVTKTIATNGDLHSDRIDNMLSQDQNTDLVNEAALTAGLIHINVETPSSSLEDADELLMNLNNQSINSLCQDAGINYQDTANNSTLPPVECTQSSEVLTHSSLVDQNQNCTSRKEVNETGQMLDVNIESMSATIRLNTSLCDHLDELLTPPSQISHVIGTKDSSITTPVYHTNRDATVTQNEDNIFDMLNDIIVARDGTLTYPPAIQRCGYVANFDTQRSELATPTAYRFGEAGGALNTEVMNSESNEPCQNACIDVLSPPDKIQNSPHAVSQSELSTQSYTTPTKVAQKNKDTSSEKSSLHENMVSEPLNCTPDNGRSCKTDLSEQIAPDTPQTLQPTHGIITASCTDSGFSSETPARRKRGRPRKTVVLPGEPLPPRPKRKVDESRKRRRKEETEAPEYDYESSAIMPLVVEARRLENIAFRVSSNCFRYVEITRDTSRATIKNVHAHLLEEADLPVVHQLSKTSPGVKRRGRKRTSFCQTIDAKLAKLAVANIVCCGYPGDVGENDEAVADVSSKNDMTMSAEVRTNTPESIADNVSTGSQPTDHDRSLNNQVTKDPQQPYVATTDDVLERIENQNTSVLETTVSNDRENTCGLSAFSDAEVCMEDQVNVADATISEINANPDTSNLATESHAKMQETSHLETSLQVVVEEQVSDATVEGGDDLGALMIVEHGTTETHGYETNELSEFVVTNKPEEMETDLQNHSDRPVGVQNRIGMRQNNDCGEHESEECSMKSGGNPEVAVDGSPFRNKTTCKSKYSSPRSFISYGDQTRCSPQHNQVPVITDDMSIDTKNEDIPVEKRAETPNVNGTSNLDADVCVTLDLLEKASSPSKKTSDELNMTGRSIFSTPSSSDDCIMCEHIESSDEVISHQVLSQSFAEGFTKLDETMSSIPSKEKTPSSSVRRRRKMFYGRPLVVTKRAVPLSIPLDCATESVRDPRYSLNRPIKKERTFMKCMWKPDTVLQHRAETQGGEGMNVSPVSGPVTRPENAQNPSFEEVTTLCGILTGDPCDWNNNITTKPSISPDVVTTQINSFSLPPVVNEASNYRVNLLLSRKVSQDTEAEFSDQGSFYQQATDEIAFGSSPRDFFPLSSDAEDNEKCASPPKKKIKPSERNRSKITPKTTETRAHDYNTRFCPSTEHKMPTRSQGLRGVLTPVSSQNCIKRTSSVKSRAELRRKLDAHFSDCLRNLDC